AVVLCEDAMIGRSLFPFFEAAGEHHPPEISTVVALPYREAMDRLSADCQKQYLTELLKKYAGNVTRAAEHAGIERESFHRLMRKCGIRADEIRRRLADR
ncbi:MAG: sigma-54-dependent Fis family transcriptional regulator, partial [Candidatus Brocadiae bacterium]|nr:sigma-54-dependent Fis family transcriptional regulator [Candidatus Brocadiia bacterium]